MRRRRVIGWVGLGFLGLCAVGDFTTVGPDLAAEPPAGPGPAEARLLCAPLPTVFRRVAVHCWLLTRAEGAATWHRWDVWQDQEAGVVAWGHVHRDLQAPLDGVGDGPPREYGRLTGAAAARFEACLQAAAPAWTHRDTYRAWPGPNSNTFIDGMVRTCGWNQDLPSTAIGKDWRGLVGGSITARGTGVQGETPLVGVRVGLHEGLELHVLTLTLGIDLWPPAITHPFGSGRFGFADW